MATPELVLHVGLQQTGARLLGHALVQLRRQLRRRGVGLIDHGQLSSLAAVEGWQRDGEVAREAAQAFERAVAARVRGERLATARMGRRLRALIITSDHLLGRANLGTSDERSLRPLAEAGVSQLLRAVRPATTQVVLHVRRQDRLMEACYLRALQNGETRRFEERFPARFEPVLDLGRLADRLAAIEGVDAVRVRPFERVGASASLLADDLLATVGLSGRLELGVVDDDRPPYRLYSHRAAAIARDVNPLLESDDELRLLRRFLLETFPGTDEASTRLLLPEERERILAAYHEVNRRLFTRYLPQLPADSYRSDAATSRLADLAEPSVAGPTRPTSRRLTTMLRAGR